jgi:hypothetical protein
MPPIFRDELDDIGLTPLGRREQRCHPVHVAGEIGVGVAECPYYTQVSIRCGKVQSRRAALGGHVWVGALFQEEPDYVRVAPESRNHKARVVIVVCDVDVGTSGNEQFDEIGVAVEAGGAKGGRVGRSAAAE